MALAGGEKSCNAKRQKNKHVLIGKEAQLSPNATGGFGGLRKAQKKQKKKASPGFEPGLCDSESQVLTVRL